MYDHILLSDVKSHSKGNIYAKAETKVRIISVHDHVLILESEKGITFSTNQNNVKQIKL